MIMYNLMLFYNYSSTKSIEFSEIYTLLLSNYIKIMSQENSLNFNFEKNDELLEIDNNYVNM